ncbi:uncharacterized protein BX664DRAFT_274111 [Halteromyces radiatus]|uniref:uncharacterized protein n=1 Tax=Halteromyces radiatus TaxID=101107 RepID=UPI0022200959|nr:uncharacterized protein BX664DRAFT_274111 [Halteromyces radiatus]KAI8096215.1 hypothetical protein BX664DRAFT_274111 [Halteromyces radiatus]
MNLKSFLFISLLFTLVLNVSAVPLQDVSVTSVDLAEENINNKGDEHLFVTVTRVDDLVDDDGSVLAERVMAVRVTFDVVENQLRCNGVPIAIGVSNIQVEAQMVSDPNKLTIDSAEELALLEDSFDIGLATVEVTATLMDELKTEEGLTFRRIAVQEMITEINNEKVVQTQAGQQLLDIFDNGRLDKWTVDPVTGFLLPEEHQQQSEEQQEQQQPVPWMMNNGGCTDLFDPIVQWWNAQSNMVRGTITGAICAFLFAVALFVRHLIISANAAYAALPLYTHEDDDDQEEVIWKQQQQQKSDPPAYQHAVDKQDDEKQPFLA